MKSIKTPVRSCRREKWMEEYEGGKRIVARRMNDEEGENDEAAVEDSVRRARSHGGVW